MCVSQEPASGVAPVNTKDRKIGTGCSTVKMLDQCKSSMDLLSILAFISERRVSSGFAPSSTLTQTYKIVLALTCAENSRETAASVTTSGMNSTDAYDLV